MSTKRLISGQKLRGGYYTPREIAMAISQWAISASGLNVLEPSFGDGEFIKSIIESKLHIGESPQNIGNHIFGCELNEDEFYKCKSFAKDNVGIKLHNLYLGDFFDWYQGNSENFDVVVGNPPFIRYQNFPEPSRTKAMIHSKQNGVSLNKLTNMWVPFLVNSAALLKTKGKLGMVIPAELLQVTYAGPLRKYLIDSFRSISILTCNELLFENAEQEVVVILADGKRQVNDADGNIELIATKSKIELIDAIKKYKPAKQNRQINHSSEKWTKYFLEQNEIEFIRSLKENKKILRFGDYFKVDVGVVTGKNDFFVINQYIANEFNLNKYVKPAIGRSYQLKDEAISIEDWEKHWVNGESVGLLDFSKLNGNIPNSIAKYLTLGLERKVNEGYKCSIRKEWYKVPSIWIPDAFMFRQIHDFPHLVLNNAEAVSTDTIHRVKKIVGKEFPQVLFYTYLTAASAEIEGRSYGGGVLELEPTEAEKLLIPNPEFIDFEKLNYLVSRKENGKFLKRNSEFILGELLNFSVDEYSLLESIYQKLFSRRKARKKINRAAEDLYICQDKFPQLF